MDSSYRDLKELRVFTEKPEILFSLYKKITKENLLILKA